MAFLKSRQTNGAGGLIVGVDLGSENARMVVAEHSQDSGEIDIVSYASVKSTGLKKGIVVNIDDTAKDLTNLLKENEMIGGRPVSAAMSSISGQHIRGQSSPALVTVKGPVVRKEDVERVLHQAQTTKLPAGREIFHVLPSEYLVDDYDGVKNPVGMAGLRLQTKVQLVTGAKSVMDNMSSCYSKVKIKLRNVVFSALAASEALLDKDERELGVILADIGAGTTDIIVWHNMNVLHVASIPVGGAVMSQDIATGLATPRNEAESIKLNHGHACAAMVDPSEIVSVPAVGAKGSTTYSRQYLASIIEPHVHDIFTQIGDEVRQAGLENHIATGLVITGGCAGMPGMVEVGKDILGINVRVGQMLAPDSEIGGMTNVFNEPEYAVALGMVLMAHRGLLSASDGGPDEDDSGDGALKRLINWIIRAF